MRNTTRFILYALIILLLILNVIVPDCRAQKSDEKNSKPVFQRKRAKTQVSNYELRLRLTDFSYRFTALVEATADSILRVAHDPDIKEAVLLWKIYGISGMNKALYKNDPIASFFDVWPYTKQMVIFFESGPGSITFKDYAPIAHRISLELESELDAVLMDVSEYANHQEYEQAVDGWVEANPFVDPYFTRKSTLPLFAKWLGEEKLGIGSSVVTITEQVGELTNRVNMYSDIIPKQIKWQIELSALELTRDIQPDSVLDLLIENTRSLKHLMDTIPVMTDENRKAAFSELDRQRILTLNKLVEERIATIDALVAERKAILDAFTNERIEFVKELNDQTDLIIQHIDSLTYDLVDKTFTKTDNIIDKIFWKALLLAAIAFAGLLIIAIVHKKV